MTPKGPKCIFNILSGSRGVENSGNECMDLKELRNSQFVSLVMTGEANKFGNVDCKSWPVELDAVLVPVRRRVRFK